MLLSIYQEIKESLSELVAIGRAGVVTQLGEAAIRLNVLSIQKEITKAIVSMGKEGNGESAPAPTQQKPDVILKVYKEALVEG